VDQEAHPIPAGAPNRPSSSSVFARETPGPIWIRCFPRNGFIAEEAVRLGAGKPVRDVIWNEKEAVEKKAAEFCYQQ
jgi:hypothetical protein